ncbi:MAG: VWA domain-containing protein, partial [Terriglobia bacterium]
MKATVAILLIGQLAAAPQQTTAPENTPGFQKSGAATFQVTTNLVVVNVTAKDKNGKPLEGLTASDFTLTEDGKAQQIGVFEYQRLEDTVLSPAAPVPAAAAAEATAAAAPAVPALKSAAAAPIAPAAKAGEVKYKDRRLLVLFFDQAGMPVADQLRTQEAATKFLKTQITASDLVAVMTYQTDLAVLQDFTDDRDRLFQVVKHLNVGDVGMANGATGDDSEPDTGAAFTQDDSEFNIFNTDRKLAALETAVKMLGSLPEKKALVYFASGMSTSGIDNQAQLRATVNAAIRSNVAFYPVDARGLVATAPLGNATQASQGGQGMYSGSSQRTVQSNFQAQQDSLTTLASDTGGKTMLDTNDLAMGIVQAQKD